MHAQTVTVARPERSGPGVAPPWSPAQRFAFRFLFSYFLLYLVTNSPLGLPIPFHEALLRKYTALWYPVVVWVGRDLLHLHQDFYLLDEGDGISNTAFGTVLFLCYLALAAMAAVVWSVLDRRRPDYRRLYGWFRFLLRFTLAMAMIHYGALKLLPAQMPSPLPLGLLTQPLGSFTRMRLLWLFMGASPAYESLTGAAELLGGVLLLFPRTTLLGALVCTADMAMVFTLNMCYDVHVKLYSFHLLFMAGLLVAPDLRRLADLLLFNRRVEPAEMRPLFARKGFDRAAQALLLLSALYTLVTSFAYGWELYQRFHPPRPPLYGIWTIEDGSPWRTVTFQKPGSVRVEQSNGVWESYALDLDLRTRTMRLGTGPDWRGRFSFAEPETDVLVLDGQWDGRPMQIALRKMPLLGDGFHWFVDLREDEKEDAKK
jgi:hypothetical protein